MEVEFLTFRDLQELVEDDDIIVKRVIHDTLSDGGFYVFYESKIMTLAQESDRIIDLIDVAKEISMEEDYQTLKNNRQREIYLLHYYALSKVDAVDVIELLQPEMAVLFKDEELQEEQ